MAPYGCLLLAPAEGWWPSATWRALRALWIPPPSPLLSHLLSSLSLLSPLLTEKGEKEGTSSGLGFWCSALPNCAHTFQYHSFSALLNCAHQFLLGLATWQQCKKKCDKGKGRRGGGGPARVWGSDTRTKSEINILFHKELETMSEIRRLNIFRNYIFGLLPLSCY